MEKVSDRQLGSIILLTIISGILMSGGSDRSMQNAWIAAALPGFFREKGFLKLLIVFMEKSEAE